MGDYDHILSKYNLFSFAVVREIQKIRLCQTVIFAKKNLESSELTNKKHEKPTLHSLIADSVLEMCKR